jgi:hypothetical protein
MFVALETLNDDKPRRSGMFWFFMMPFLDEAWPKSSLEV